MLYAMRKRVYPQQELARRLCDAMEEQEISSSDLARACHVSRQVVYEWRRTGRIGKHHLVDIARMTRKPLEYFLVGLRAAVVLFALIFALPQSSEGAILHKADYPASLRQISDLFIHYTRRLIAWLGRCWHYRFVI